MHSLSDLGNYLHSLELDSPSGKKVQQIKYVFNVFGVNGTFGNLIKNYSPNSTETNSSRQKCAYIGGRGRGRGAVLRLRSPVEVRSLH